MMEGEHKEGMKCECKHHKVVPFMVVLIALVFLLERMSVIDASTGDIFWPIFLGVAGVTKMMQGSCKCC